MSNKVIITAAISGAEVTQEMNPAVFTQRTMCAKPRAHEAGAAIIHFMPVLTTAPPLRTANASVYKRDQEACPDVIISPQPVETGMTADERLQPTELNRNGKPGLRHDELAAMRSSSAPKHDHRVCCSHE